MELNQFLTAVKAKKQAILMIVLIFLVISLVITFAQPIKYSSRLKLLVVQNVSQNSSDPYAMAVSNEYLSNILSKITYSNSFFNRVLNSGFEIKPDYFGKTTKKQEKIWNKTISTNPLNDTGIITITAYHKDRAETERIARAVGYVLMTEHSNYHGLGDNLRIKLLDEPITSKYPVKPNIALNLGLAIFLGLVFGLCYVYLVAEKISIDYNNDVSEIKYDDLHLDDNDPFYQFVDESEEFNQDQEFTEDEEDLIKKLNF
ncbi:MAG: Wzz/FepE/Etk N-terminal domain-containing protein [bacterium]